MAEYFDRMADDASDNEEVDENGEELDRQENGVNGNGERFEDSSDEDDDDDEDARREVEEGFIDDEDEDDADAARRRRIRRKRKRREEREEEGLDEDDLDLIGVRPEPAPQENKLKRLKRGHRTEEPERATGLRDIFADDYDDEDNDAPLPGFTSRAVAGEFDDFIEQDEADEQAGEEDDDREVRLGPRRTKGLDALKGADTGLDEMTLEDMRAAFGDGTEYDWALHAQEDEDDDLDNERGVELKDVFEPSQLAERMLTDEDNAIRNADVPERFQIARQPFPVEDLSDEEQSARLTDEAAWISTLLLPKKRFSSPEVNEAFRKSIRQVLSYFNVDNLEVPFIFQHRKDYLIHSVRVQTEPDPDDPDKPTEVTNAEKLLNQSDLWEVFELDLKYRALMQRRQALQKLYAQVKETRGAPDDTVENALKNANSLDEVQDLQDYLNFQYAGEIKDSTLRDVVNGQKRSKAGISLYERVRAASAYNVVRGFGVNPDSFARSILEESRVGLTEDPEDRPDDLADKSTDDTHFQTGSLVLKVARQTFVEELATCPRMRKVLRDAYYMGGRFDCIRTSKGLRQIDVDHSNYDFKYLRNQDLASIARKPELFLRMLKAEADGLVELQLRLAEKDRFLRRLEKYIQSDNLSEVADNWNRLRKEALGEAVAKLSKVMVRGVKENLKSECENQLARKCRDEYSQRLDQAPYRPRGTEPGTSARVLALTNGHGMDRGKALIHWSIVDPGGRSVEHGVWSEIRLGNEERGIPNGEHVAAFVDLVDRRRPDVIGISGFTPDTRSLYKDLQAIIEHYNLQLQWDEEDGTQLSERHEVIMINDEVARLYHNSDKARSEHPHFQPLTAYCIALGRYVQGPIKEYAMLGRDILSISFDPNQGLIPQDKLLKHLETAMIDMVNITGVEINDAVEDNYVANLVQYVCGLGPRKASAMLRAVNRRPGGKVKTRAELIGDPDQGIVQAVSPHVFHNCASFLSIDYDSAEPDSNYLDSTRIHPEDYELATKMAADALDLDEEDIAAEKNENGEWAVLRALVRDDHQEKVNDLMLELYAEQLEANFQQRKRATLETIRAELQEPYEELRNDFVILSSDEVFTMLTGETRDSLCEGMVVSVTVRKCFPDHVEVRLDCGIEGGISESEYPSYITPSDARHYFAPFKTLPAKLTFLNRKQLTAQLSLREENTRQPYRRELDHEPGEWDHVQEDQDRRDVLKREEEATGRAQRVIKHPLFKAFNAAQAEEYLGPQGLGDLVIRPSSKGLDHLTVTWKVSDNVFQHIDVLELDKENEFSVGRQLRIGGRYTYTDLDELIDGHVQAMARKVREIKNDERFNDGSKTQAENWLTSYMEANPKRAMYAFCINSQYPGYFHLCFKQSPKSSIVTWPVKVVPNAFEMQKNQYPDMGALRNGFKTILMHQQQANGRR